MALILLRYVFSGLGVVDWEDIDVWEKVRSRTGRAFPAGFDADGSALGEVGATILRLWSEPGGVLRSLDARTRARTSLMSLVAKPRMRPNPDLGACSKPRCRIKFVTKALFPPWRWVISMT